jgi:dihydrofolate reductase
MKNIKLNLIAAACDNMGIGYRGDLPWFLKNELRHFSRTTRKLVDSNKKNVVIMGRKTYFGVPESKRPLADRINVVLTTDPDKYTFPEGVLVARR